MRIAAFILASLLLTSSGFAEVFKSHALSGGKFTLGVEPEFTIADDNDFTFYLHGGFGLGRGYALHAKVGFGESQFNDDDVQFSGMLDIPLFERPGDFAGLFAAIGGSNWGDGAIEQQLILHFNLKVLTLYTGIDSAIVFAPNDDVDWPLEIVFGIDFPVRRPLYVMVEGGVNLHNSSSYVSPGIRLYF